MSSKDLRQLKSVIFGILIVVLFTLTSGSLHSDLDKPYKFVHPSGKSERELSICEENAPCSLIQNPFFFPFIVKRLCRCKNKECPDSYEIKRSLDTVFVNNREQMKFCDDLPKCSKGILRVGHEDSVSVHLNCFCPKRRYWRLIRPDEMLRDTTNSGHDTNLAYSCEKLERCRKTCGTLRSDLHATYQNCTCPLGHLCLPSLEAEINEPLYNGHGFTSACTLLPDP